MKIYFEIPRSPWDGTLAEPITLQYLISHTAGFEDQNIGLFVLTEEQLQPLSAYVAEALPARVFPPGQISSYSNYGSFLMSFNGAQASEVRSSVLQAFMDRYFPQETKPLTPSGDVV
ncbi:MAG: hypothetical protein ACOX57_04515 [Limnochordia bacterium]|nr:hypothetical protein [Bacillota bacterium]HHT90863.1 hypothetical protein [Bacillota bacterium]